jgi:hypothetical protein
MFLQRVRAARVSDCFKESFMKRLVSIALVAAVLAFAPAKASAVSITLDQCVNGQCQGFGGTVDILLNVVGSDLLIQATNNLTSGAITQLGFDFQPLGSQQNYSPAVAGVPLSSGGDGVSFSNLQFVNGIGNFVVDLGLGGLDNSGQASSWAPGETITIQLDTTPDLTNALLSTALGFAQIQGAGGAGPVGGPNSFQLTGGVQQVPESSSLLLILSGLALASRPWRTWSRRPRA